MKTPLIPLATIAAIMMTAGCVHPQAMPAPTPTPAPAMTPVPQAVQVLPTEAPAAPPVEITPAAPPQVINVPPSPRARPTRRRYLSGMAGTRYRVRPGDNLWEIAKRAYGNPWRWRGIFHANQGRIHNPALIYPGQVFHLPAGRPVEHTWRPTKTTRRYTRTVKHPAARHHAKAVKRTGKHR